MRQIEALFDVAGIDRLARMLGEKAQDEGLLPGQTECGQLSVNGGVNGLGQDADAHAEMALRFHSDHLTNYVVRDVITLHATF